MAVSLRMCLVALAVLPAVAALPTPACADGPVAIPVEGVVASPATTTSACAVEPYARDLWSLYLGGNDTFDGTYYLVRPEDCPTCATGDLLLTRIEVGIEIAEMVLSEYDFKVELSVVEAEGTECPVPKPLEVICPPHVVEFTTSSLVFVVSLPLSSMCVIDRPAFVCVRFLDPGTGFFTEPAVMTGLGETCCHSYFTSVRDYPDPVDPCNYTAGFWYSVKADCFTSVPVLRQSWGQVKQLYR